MPTFEAIHHHIANALQLRLGWTSTHIDTMVLKNPKLHLSYF
jgi:hypothetical protein